MWFIDKNSPNHWISHRIKKRVASARTPYQRVEILDTYEFGRMVILDGKIQSAESDEHVYHEILVHPAMIAHPKPEHVLILGAGEGATLREVLKHPMVKRAIMIDIDREFVALCRRFLKKWHRGAFRHEKARVVFEDAFSYLEGTPERFDVIIADISDPDETGPARLVYTEEFYSLIERVLKPSGIFTTHATAVYYAPHENRSSEIVAKLKRIFPRVDMCYEYIPSFGCLWSFATASRSRSPRALSEKGVERRLKDRGIEMLSYYGPHTHRRLFIIPPCLEENFLRGESL